VRVVDVPHVTFIDSTGTNALLRANRSLQAAAGSRLRLSSIPDAPRAMRVVGLDQVINVHPGLEAALQK
jgi:anti-anti-sigma regulatory factor